MEPKAKRSIQVSAKTVDLAVEKGLAQLGLSRDQVEVQVIKEGSRGVLGIGAEDALVSILLPEPEAAVAEAQPEPPPPSSVAAAPQGDAGSHGADDDEEGYVSAKPRVQDAGAAPADVDPAAVAQAFLQDLLERMGIGGARVELVEPATPSEEREDTIILNVTGDDLGVLIGRRGETLRDVQFITRLAVSRQIQNWPNIVVDIEYYKMRREKLLVDLARRMAEKARLNHQPVALEPMPAHERRIVHMALRDYPGVFTESTGEDEARKVVIMPRP